MRYDGAGDELESVKRPALSPKVNRWCMIALCAVFALSIAIRIPRLHYPITESYAFRQTQTAITVRVFVQEGIDLIRYQTPVLGEPWRIPFEFPVYQATAAVVYRMGVRDLDLACRVAALLYFYLSAGALFLILRRMFGNPPLTLFTMAFFLLSPYTVVWSIAALPDFCSVFFALAYGSFIVFYKAAGRRVLNIALGLVSGTMAYLAKSSTMVPFAILIACYLLSEAWSGVKEGKRTPGAFFAYLKANRAYYLAVAALVVLPVIPGYWWVKYTDQVKNLSPYTQWLTSANLRTWNFLTIFEDVMSAVPKWPAGTSRIFSMFFPVLSPVLVMFAFTDGERRVKAAAAASLAAVALTFMLMVNLYTVHDYYSIAFTVSISFALGAGMTALLRAVARQRGKALPALFAAVLLVSGVWQNARLIDSIVVYLPADKNPMVKLGEKIRAATQAGDTILVEGYDWSSEVLYYAQRKGMMLYNRFHANEALVDSLASIDFGALVTTDADSGYLRFLDLPVLAGRENGTSIYVDFGKKEGLSRTPVNAEAIGVKPTNGTFERSGGGIRFVSSVADPYYELDLGHAFAPGKNAVIEFACVFPGIEERGGDTFALYYTTADQPEFTESNAMQAAVISAEQNIRFLLPPDVARLRIDPIVGAGEAWIKGIVVYQ